MAVEFSMTVTGLKEVSDVLQNLYEAVEHDQIKFLKGVGLIVERSAKRKVRVRTGQTRGSIRAANPERLIGGAQVKVVANKSTAQYLEMGTRPHEIRPKTKKALFWPGAAHPVKVVHHPGTKSYPFMYPALEENFRNITREVAKGVDKAVKRGIKK